MTECQGCGAWNERHRTLCVLCGTPLAETDEWDAATELPPLPPLPDGGLSLTMPAWLRAAPDTPAPSAPRLMTVLAMEEETTASAPTAAGPAGDQAGAVAAADAGEPAPVDTALAEQPLGQQADPRTFLRDVDFPRWIRELPALPPRPVPLVAVLAPPEEATVLGAPPADPAPARVPTPGPTPALGETLPPAVLPPLEAGARAPVPASSDPRPEIAPDATAHQREAWETPLLVVLVVGAILAVIWALFVNGMFGSGL